MAASYPEIFFVSCALNDKEVAIDIIEESEWGNMTHLYVEPAVKEALKAQFGFTEVPFCLVIDQV